MSAENQKQITISIHALREEGDRCFIGFSHKMLISIHALREEGDRQSKNLLRRRRRFLSTPSVRRATQPETAAF